MKLKKNKPLLIGSLLLGTTIILGGLTAAYVSNQAITHYDKIIHKINQTEGVTAKLGSYDILSGDVSTLISLNQESTEKLINQFPWLLSNLPNSSENIAIQIFHKIDYFTYPIEIQHEVTYRRTSDQLKAISKEQALAKGDKLPVQLLSHHFENGDYRVMGLTDQIKYGNDFEIFPTRILFTSKNNGEDAELKTQSPLMQIFSEGNVVLKARDIAFNWSGSMDDCLVCQGSQTLIADEIIKYNAATKPDLYVGDMFIKTNTSMDNGDYNAYLTASASSIESEAFAWNEMKFKSSVMGISSKAITEATAIVEESYQSSVAPDPSFLSEVNQKAYARILEAGLKFNIDEFDVYTSNGPANVALNIELPKGRMPNMRLNPLGLITIINADLKAKVPPQEITRLLGKETTNEIYKMGFIKVSPDGKSLSIDASIEEGDAIVNGVNIQL